MDDERIIRDGIARIDWKEKGFTLAGTAKNGLEAYEMILNNPPDIVITDVKMPGMNGLELIEKVKDKYPHIQFIVLSGYGEFEFAATAMKFGVKYYLLKPCNNAKILEIMPKVTAEIEMNKAKDTYINKIKSDFQKIIPLLKEQFFKDFITGRISGKQEWDYYRSLFDINLDSDQKVRLILAIPEESAEMEYLYALKRLAEETVGEEKLILSTTIGEQVLLLVRAPEEIETLLELSKKVKRLYCDYYQKDITIVISEENNIGETPILYKKTRDYLGYRFYLGGGSIITDRDIHDAGSTPEFIYDYDYLGILVQSGNVKEIKSEIDGFFSRLSQAIYDINATKAYCLNLFSAIVRQSRREKLDEYMKKLMEFEKMSTLDQIHCFAREIAMEICEDNYKRNIQRFSQQIQRMLQLVHENLDREELSLKWLAKELLYMNVDYLGKLFKKELNEKFSDYLLRIRMEKAKELIMNNDYKIFEIASKVGFGNNSQYFSRIFKKHFGYSPTEYKKFFTGVNPDPSV